MLTSLSLSSLTDGLDKQKGFEGLVDVSLSQDHLSLKVDETKLNELGLSDTENYFISLPYLYDDGWGEEAFSYHGFLAFHIKDLEVNYRVKGAKLGAIISASSFISLPILYFIVVHHDKKKKRKKELVIEVNSASNLSETNDTNLYTFEEENAFNKGPNDKKKVKYLVVIKDKKKKDKTL